MAAKSNTNFQLHFSQFSPRIELFSKKKNELLSVEILTSGPFHAVNILKSGPFVV